MDLPQEISKELTPEAQIVLHHGDVRDLLATMQDNFARLIITSPPYNLGKEYEKRVALKTWKNLGSLTAFFGLNGDKTKIYRPNWMEVLSPCRERHDEAMKHITYHCEEDVMMNRQVFYELWKRDYKMVNLPMWRKWQ